MNAKPRLLYLPPVHMSPESCRSLPALDRFVETLEAAFELEVFQWPWLKGATPNDGSVPAQGAAIRECLSPGCHVVSSGGGTGFCLRALNSQPDIASFISFGLALTTATLRSLGETEALARAAALEALVSSGSYQFLRASMQGAADEDIARAAELFDSELDMARMRKAIRAYFQFDLSEEPMDIQAPTLFLVNRSEFMGDTTGEFFARLVPHAEVRTGHSWNDRYQDEQAGREAASLVLEFIDELQRPVLNEETHLISIGGRQIQLTPLECGLFGELCQRAGDAVSRQNLLQKVWGYDYMGGANVVDVAVMGLRKKLGDHASLIETVRGAGYRYNPPPSLI